jgi:toxin FitB
MHLLARWMNYLVDTNVLSELARRKPHAGVQAWARSVSRVALSVVTVEEIFFGLAWKPNPRIRAWFDAFLQQHCDVHPITSEIACVGGELRGRLAGRGAVRTQADMFIAATAQAHHLTLVTRNSRDFEGCGIGVFNPFD